MSLEELEPDEVLALRYDEPTAGPDLAHWCGGGLIGETVIVPSLRGPVVARVGDWIVRDAGGGWSVLPHGDFVLHYGAPSP